MCHNLGFGCDGSPKYSDPVSLVLALLRFPFEHDPSYSGCDSLQEVGRIISGSGIGKRPPLIASIPARWVQPPATCCPKTFTFRDSARKACLSIERKGLRPSATPLRDTARRSAPDGAHQPVTLCRLAAIMAPPPRRHHGPPRQQPQDAMRPRSGAEARTARVFGGGAAVDDAGRCHR